MHQFQALSRDLAEADLDHWFAPLQAIMDERLSQAGHGDFSKWQAIVDALPSISPNEVRLDIDAVTVVAAQLADDDHDSLREMLLALHPWRKGPFNICGIDVDTEWRSNWKWRRLESCIEPLTGRHVLDVGSGNGYYAYRMLGAGARLVIGIDPTILFVMQFTALNKLVQAKRIHVLPLRLHEIPAPCAKFDTTFSMGVLYHQRDPHAHLRQLLETLRPGGQLVLETLVIRDAGHDVLVAGDRYARMRNVWHLPPLSVLVAWLQECGFENISTIDISATTTEEQRSTEWMPFESLREALDPDDPDLTIEGYPAPTRALLTCNAPGS